jgi:UDP-N-acetylmuramoyl-L-alanyl-D-glutamate--2,6-diaminopimelate ligase
MKDAPKKTSLKPKVQKAKAKLAAAYYGKPAKDMKIIAVTGTTGKDTVANFIHEILKALDPRAGLVVAGEKGMTAGSLQKQLSKSWKEGANYVVVEAPAGAVEKYVFHGLPLHMVVVTDVADENAAEKKTILLEAAPEFSVLNRDDPYFEAFAKYPVKTAASYGKGREATTWIGHSKIYKRGTEVNLTYSGNSFDLATYVVGEAALSYMAAAATAGLLLGAEVDAIIDGIANYEP